MSFDHARPEQRFTQQAARATLLLVCVLLVACGTHATQQVDTRLGQARVIQVPLSASRWLAHWNVVDEELQLRVASAECVEETETPVVTTTRTESTDRMIARSPVASTIAITSTALAAISLPGALNGPETCPESDEDCTTRDVSHGGVLVFGGLAAIAWGYTLLSPPVTKLMTCEQQRLEVTRGKSAPCQATIAHVPVEVFAPGAPPLSGTTDSRGNIALRAEPRVVAALRQGSAKILIGGQLAQSVADAPPTEPLLYPGPVELPSTPVVPGKVETDEDLLVEWDGDWYRGRVLDVGSRDVGIRYHGWDSSWDERVPWQRLHRVTPGVSWPTPQIGTRGFGTAERLPFAFWGRVFALPDGASLSRWPSIDDRAALSELFTHRLDATRARLDLGAHAQPGEHQARRLMLVYSAPLAIRSGGVHQFRLRTDGRARLLVDGRSVVEADAGAELGAVNLSEGTHTVDVWYLPSAGTEHDLVLESGMEGGPLRTLDVRRYNDARTVVDASGNIKITLGEAILFDFDQHSLKPKSEAILDDLYANLLSSTAYSKLLIEGHTDDRGSDAHNLQLSRRRAQEVAQALEKRGVPTARIAPEGFGKRRPKVANSDEAGRAQNRRVEITIVK